MGVFKKYLIYIFIAVGIWFSFRYLLPLVLPLVLAALVVIPSASVIHTISSRLHIGRGILTGALLIFIVFILLLLLWMLLVWAAGSLSAIFQNSTTIWAQFCDLVCEGCGMLEKQTGMEQGTITAVVQERGTVMLSDLQNMLLPKVMTGSMKSVRSMINVIVTLLIASLAAVLLAKDYTAIRGKILQSEDISVVAEIFRKLGRMLAGYVKAQGIIFTVIAGICLSGYWLIHLRHPFQTALVTAFLDVLPFIGTGIVLVPMAVWHLLNKSYWKALVCAGIYLLCIVTRELLEPRLIGKNTGIFPVVILISIYTGIKLYGIGGVILGPISLLLYLEITKALHKFF